MEEKQILGDFEKLIIKVHGKDKNWKKEPSYFESDYEMWNGFKKIKEKWLTQEVVNINLFGKRGLDNALKKLKLKIIKCTICKKKINKEQIAAFYPKKKGVGICCEKPSCYIMAIFESRKFEDVTKVK